MSDSIQTVDVAEIADDAPRDSAFTEADEMTEDMNDAEEEVAESVIATGEELAGTQETELEIRASEEQEALAEQQHQEELAADRYANFQAFCTVNRDESQAAMERVLTGAKENIFYLLKAYEALGGEEYQAWASVEEIFTDQVIDTMCDGDPFAVAAVNSAITSFQEGDSLTDTFGEAMVAAVEEIPAVAKDAFLEELLGGYVMKGLDIYQGTLEATDAQKQYALSLLKGKMNEGVEELIFLLSAEEISGEDLVRCAGVVSEIYTLVQETEYRFKIEMPVEEWKSLQYLLYADADAYENHSRRKELYESYLEVDSAQLCSFLEEKALTREELERKALELDEYFSLTFLMEYSAYLDVGDNCETLRSMDYAQMTTTAHENMLLGGLNAAFGNFLTDMLMATNISNDMASVDGLYHFVSAAEDALESCRGGINGLESILDDADFMVYEFYNIARAPEEYSLEEQNYMWFIFDHYYQGEGKPTLACYQEQLDEYCKKVMAYEMLLETCVIPGQKALMDMTQEVNIAYIERLQQDKDLLLRSCDILGREYESVDTSQEQAVVTEAYVAAINTMIETYSCPPDTKKFEQRVSVEGMGDFNVLVFMKMDMENANIPFYVRIEGLGRLLEIYSYEQGNISAIVWDKSQYITYSRRYYNNIHLVRVSNTNIENLDNKDNEWYDCFDLESCNDDYSYVSNALVFLMNMGEDSVQNSEMLEHVVRGCAQMWVE